MEEKALPMVYEQVKSPVAEAYRVLRTNLQFCQTDATIKSILLTSAGPGEGKSTTIANTAVALAKNGKNVVLVDCDLRKPQQHHIFQLGKNGVTNYLTQCSELNDLLQISEIPGLTVLTSGPVPPNPSELLGSEKMLSLLNQLRERFDYVLLDTPPIVAVTDAAVLASRVDGVLLVVHAGVARPEMVQQAKQLIISAHGKLLGVVLNRVEISQGHNYYYYYYGSEGEKQKAKKRKDA